MARRRNEIALRVFNLLNFASLPTCGFVAQLVLAPNRYLGGTGSSPVEARIFSGFNFLIALIAVYLRG